MTAIEAAQRIEETNAVIRLWKREGRPLRLRREEPPPSPTPEEADPDRLWEVDDLLDVKREDGVLYYKIKWTNYDEPSWEPIGNLNCPAMLERFDRVVALSFDWDE
ncbi:hypothetical protein AAVH_40973 [Aphelenchoides avenae]|nr:hypothetical protein AAVH_40973 [Aphelenchus avenae]